MFAKNHAAMAISAAVFILGCSNSVLAQNSYSVPETRPEIAENAQSETLAGPVILASFVRMAGQHSDPYSLKVASFSRTKSMRRKDEQAHLTHLQGDMLCVEAGYLKLARESAENATCEFRMAREEVLPREANAGAMIVLGAADIVSAIQN
ncbi:hypothetical protein [Hyphococcus sp.]|jgi:hypothetical protein|uniref:hypothetical protein n=1 Tax=Hyphococcus sp. TaxID=2038636 RepID=UPI003D0CC9A3